MIRCRWRLSHFAAAWNHYLQPMKTLFFTPLFGIDFIHGGPTKAATLRGKTRKSCKVEFVWNFHPGARNDTHLAEVSHCTAFRRLDQKCLLKIKCWFRCISYWDSPFFGGHSLEFVLSFSCLCLEENTWYMPDWSIIFDVFFSPCSFNDLEKIQLESRGNAWGRPGTPNNQFFNGCFNWMIPNLLHKKRLEITISIH